MAGIGHNQKAFVSLESLNAEERDQLKDCINELNDSMTRVAAERELQKEAIANIAEELGVDKKLIRRMARVHFKANFNEEVESDDTFEQFYEAILKTK